MALGSIIGGLAGAGSGIFGDMEARRQRKAAEEANRPKRRKFSALMDRLGALQEQKLASGMTLSQAAFNWAGNLR